MSSPPPRGWSKLQAMLLAEVKAYDKQTLRHTPQIRITNLSGQQYFESHEQVYFEDDHFADEDNLLKAQAAAQKLALVRKAAGHDKTPCKVAPALYIGPIGAARNLKALRKCGITHIVNASPVVPCFFQNNPEGAFVYHSVPIYDDASMDLLPYLDDVVEFIAEGRKTGGVLVHCYAGQSRSSAIVIAYLMAHERMTLSQAWAAVRRARPSAQPNQGFLRQLAEYKESVLGTQQSVGDEVPLEDLVI